MSDRVDWLIDNWRRWCRGRVTPSKMHCASIEGRYKTIDWGEDSEPVPVTAIVIPIDIIKAAKVEDIWRLNLTKRPKTILRLAYVLGLKDGQYISRKAGIRYHDLAKFERRSMEVFKGLVEKSF